MGRAGLLLAAALAARLPPAAAASASASWGGSAAGAPAEVEGQQECEHAALRVEALQRGSALAGGAPPPAAEGAGADREVEGNPYVLGPNLYLASEVDTGNYRGYCLDIAGSPPHPQCGSVQGHSCKSEGEDTQFEYDVRRKQVRSLNFNRNCNPLYSGTKNNRSWSADETNSKPACVTVKKYKPGSTFSLTGCAGDMSQRITYTSSRQLQVGEGSLCLVLGINKTGEYEDFMLRPAELQPCDTWPAELSTWEALDRNHARLGGAPAV